MSDDAVLLRRYATGGDEAAFRQIVERHLPLVYAAALRQVGGDRLMAEDVAQNVFYDLARHAGEFQKDELVVRWLYRATRFAAANAVRTERRRRVRENAYVEDLVAVGYSPVAVPGAETPAWEDACAHLDAAVSELPEKDRDAIFLRFFQGLDLRAVGEALQTSGDTAQKRVSRALEKLRTLLAQRGVALSVTALAAFLTEPAAAAPPPGLVEAIAQAAGEVALAAAGVGASGAGATASPHGLSIAAATATAAALVVGALLLGLWRNSFSSGASRGGPPGLVSRWTGDGHTEDATGRNPALLEGNVTYAPGLVGQAFHFDGTEGTRLVVPDSPSLNLTNEITLACWFRPDEDSNAGSLLAKRADNPAAFATGEIANYGLQLNPIVAGFPQWGIGAYYNDPAVQGGYHLSRSRGDTNSLVSSRNLMEQLAFFPEPRRDLAVLRGQWHHLAATFQQRPGSQLLLALYYDGALRAQTAIPGVLARSVTDAPLAIGGAPYVWFKGRIDDIRVYERVLPPGEIQSLATNTPGASIHARNR